MNSIYLFFINIFKFIIPETRGFTLKRFLYRMAKANIGSNVRICSSSNIMGNGLLTVGENTWIGHNSLIVCTSKIVIGSNVDIGPMVFIGTGTHEIEPESDHIAGKGKNLDIFIGDGSWIGANSTILAGVTIGSKVVIAAGSVVVANVSSYTIVAGVPAKPIKMWDVYLKNWINLQ